MIRINNLMKDFYKDKKILITGNTGFKGTWLTLILNSFGCNNIYGISLKEKNSFFNIVKKKLKIKTFYIDIRDNKVINKIKEINPDIVFHLAAQPLVLPAYDNPKYTYETNVIGTVNVCEAIKQINKIVSFINVTTDKVYRNMETMNKYKEDDYIGGYDPYSCSKSCSDLITTSYAKKIFNKNIYTSICRAGNVIGGGDFAEKRIVPDIFRSIKSNSKLIIRSKTSIRPYQHVLEANFVYILIVMLQYNNSKFCGEYNISPDDNSIVSTNDIIKLFNKKHKLNIVYQDNNENKESNLLLLSNSKLKKEIKWHPILDINECVDWTYKWYIKYLNNEDMYIFSLKQIDEYFDKFNKKVLCKIL